MTNNTYNYAPDPKRPIYIARCEEYDEEKIFLCLKKIFESAVKDAEQDAEKNSEKISLCGKRVVIKPNLVAKKSPEDPAIVNPNFVSAVIRMLRELGADDITIAESPGGIYNASRLRGIYSASGIDAVAEKHGVKLNYDLGYSEVPYADGKICRLFEIIDPILRADVIVDICRLKTHALTGMSCAVKNLFGTIPGIVKFEMHSRYPDYDDFADMLVDLCEMLSKRAQIISVTDAITGMEGNGPTAGNARKIGAILVSENPFASDVVASQLINCAGKISTVEHAAERGLSFKTSAECNVIDIDGGNYEELTVKDYVQPDSTRPNTIEVLKNLWGGKIYKLFEPYPVVDHSMCIGCGECAASCPQKTIKMVAKEDAGTKKALGAKGAKVPVIIRDKCIKCFCCQELCPHKVIKIKKNPITRILS